MLRKLLGAALAISIALNLRTAVLCTCKAGSICGIAALDVCQKAMETLAKAELTITEPTYSHVHFTLAEAHTEEPAELYESAYPTLTDKPPSAA